MSELLQPKMGENAQFYKLLLWNADECDETETYFITHLKNDNGWLSRTRNHALFNKNMKPSDRKYQNKEKTFFPTQQAYLLFVLTERET